jgi:ABC-type polysaccharide/polyol phosphate export permease
MMNTIPNVPRVFRYRWLLYELVMRDLVLRYRGSLLGFAWTLLNPILFMAVYTMVFSVILKSSIPHYPLFLLSGLIPWLWFSGAVTQSSTAILGGSTYIGKTLMPSELLVLVPVVSNGVNFLITILLLLPVSIVFGTNIMWGLLFLPALALIELCMTLGLALMLATATVFYRDLQQIITYVFTAMFFLSPIFYTKENVPENLRFLVTYNPLASLVSAFHDTFYKGVAPNFADIVPAATFSLCVLAIGLAYFNSMRDTFGEHV